MEATQIDPIYVRPGFGTPLRRIDNRLVTPEDADAYPVRDGIPDFRSRPSLEDAAAIASLERLNDACVRLGWRAALDEVHGHDPGFIRYVTDASRTRFLELLPLRAASRVLEIGPGLAQITSALAARVGHVDALEIVPGQARFVAERCRQEGHANVRVAVGGDDGRLPYAAGSYDLVVLNLVFEWCAQRCPDEPFEAVQRRLLDEMHRVLVPGGCLYLATKNRYSLHYLLGKRDEHAHQLRFGNALPRWLTGRLLRARGHARPGGLLHSHDALRRMLGDAGFERIRSFWAVPEMRYPEHYIETDAASVRRARGAGGLVQGHQRSTRLLMRFVPAGWVRHVTPGLAFVAFKAAAG